MRVAVYRSMRVRFQSSLYHMLIHFFVLPGAPTVISVYTLITVHTDHCIPRYAKAIRPYLQRTAYCVRCVDPRRWNLERDEGWHVAAGAKDEARSTVFAYYSLSYIQSYTRTLL